MIEHDIKTYERYFEMKQKEYWWNVRLELFRQFKTDYVG
jgi:hypothetical protein